MARRITTTRTTHLARAFGVALVSALIGFSATRAQGPPLAADAPADAPTPLSKSCQIGATTIAEELPLPNVAAALAQRKTLRILAMGAAPGRVGSHGNGYTAVIEAILSHALKGIDVVIINRGVSGELAANAATRMKNEVALVEPDLVLWQVGTNDALAYVPVGEFTTTVKDQIDWLTKHKVDVLLVGLQFANQVLHDAQYAEVRDALRKLAAAENVIVVRLYEAMQILNQAADGPETVAEEFSRIEGDYNCLAQYVARAITLGAFGKNIPRSASP
jgi:acyl-CoA thioesterase I